jgi:hypothetical protein
MKLLKVATALLRYEAETGQFYWRERRSPKARVGALAGSVDAYGYRCIKIQGRHYKAHRFAWLFAYGIFPKHQLDHINGDKLDNRLSNLREATNAENHQNLREANKDSSSGLLGACKAGARWRAKIVVDGRFIQLGSFGSAREAHSAYLRAKKKLHPFQTIASKP